MEKQQQFCVSSSCSSARKIQNLKKRKERDHHHVRSQVPTRFLPLFDEYPSSVKKPKTSSAVSSIVSSRTAGTVLKEPRIFYGNWVNKINSAGRDSRNIESAGRDSSNDEGLFSGLLPLFSESPSWSEKPKTSVPISSTGASRNPGRVLKELKLFDDKPLAKNSADQESGKKESVEEFERRVASNLMKMKSSYTLEELQEERSRGVSTRLSLYPHDPFKIKKKMKPSDLGNLCRLLVSANLVEKHILPSFNEDQIKLVEVANQEINGLKVWVWDMNTESMHQLVFKRWSTSKSYIFNDGWRNDFVKRRNLVEGDEIGLYWDNDHSRFHFNVLSRAAVIG